VTQRLATLVVLLLPMLAGASFAETLRSGRYQMGTVLEITLEDADPARAREALDDCFALGARLERIFTTFDTASPTSRMNASAGAPFAAPPELVHLLRDARRFGALTDGAFDVTVGPLMALWREAARSGRWPGAREISSARARVGVDRIRIDAAGRVTLAPGMAVDFGGLAKGWALDRMGELLRKRGITRALLDFGGSSLLALGTPAGAPGWRILVSGRAGALGVVTLHDQSLSVSASLSQSSTVKGRRLGHVIDPRSGRPLEEERQAVVSAPDGARAEALSTALLVLPVDRGLALVEERPGVEAWIRGFAQASVQSRGFAPATSFEAAEDATEGGASGL